MWRVDHTNGWIEDRQSYPAQKKIVDYFNANFYLTTSGNFRTQTLTEPAERSVEQAVVSSRSRGASSTRR